MLKRLICMMAACTLLCACMSVGVAAAEKNMFKNGNFAKNMNNWPHIGNTYEIVLADAIARSKRQLGYDVYFQTGTDEHGLKIQQKAEAAGITPQQYVDNVAGEIKRIWDLMNTTYDKFVRTTDPMHKEKVQKIFRKMYEKGDIYKGKYTGKYCTPCESFWTESQLVVSLTQSANSFLL